VSKGFSVMAEALRRAGYVVEKRGRDAVVVQGARTVVVDTAERPVLKVKDLLVNVEATHGKIGAKAIARNVARARAERKIR
jgi:hypothetical protein